MTADGTLDSSAFVKLVIPEPETAALVAALTTTARLVASEILEVEALRAARRANGEDGGAVARAGEAGLQVCAPTPEQPTGEQCQALGPRSAESI